MGSWREQGYIPSSSPPSPLGEHVFGWVNCVLGSPHQQASSWPVQGGLHQPKAPSHCL